MAGGVSVERAAVEGGIKCCQASIQELTKSSQLLRRNYQQAGSNGWKDQKYTALGNIVDECCGALDKPVTELEGCIEKLRKLLGAVGSYEEVKL